MELFQQKSKQMESLLDRSNSRLEMSEVPVNLKMDQFKSNLKKRKIRERRLDPQGPMEQISKG